MSFFFTFNVEDDDEDCGDGGDCGDCLLAENPNKLVKPVNIVVSAREERTKEGKGNKFGKWLEDAI